MSFDQGAVDPAVRAYLDSLDEVTARDADELIALMQRISGHPPRLWNVGTVGFDEYHYKYASGREGDNHCLGFYPRKGKITIYLMDGTERHAAALDALGKTTRSRVCVYIKSLGDIDLKVLEQILRDSYSYLKTHDGSVDRVM